MTKRFDLTTIKSHKIVLPVQTFWQVVLKSQKKKEKRILSSILSNKPLYRQAIVKKDIENYAVSQYNKSEGTFYIAG